MATVNTDWFKEVLARKKLSQRALARMINVDNSAISLALRGKRSIKPHELHQIATILGVTVAEVMRQTGVQVLDNLHQVPLSSWMDSSGAVFDLPDHTHDQVISPADCPIGTYAVQVRSPQTIKDGWLLFVDPERLLPVENLDHLCVCATTTGDQMIGVIRRGYRARTTNVVLWPSGNLRTDNDLAWTSAVLWIKPR